MVILKQEPLPNLPAAQDDAPPSYYHHLEPSSSSSIRSQNRPPPPTHPHRPTVTPTLTPSPSPPRSSSSYTSGSTSGSTSTSQTHTLTSLIEAKVESQKAKLVSGLIELLGGGTAQTTKDVKNAAYKSIQDVVKHPGAQHSAALIETCAEMCRAKGVNFCEILQDPVFEGHRALYWIIISRPPPSQDGLLCAILKHCGSLCPEAVNEVRLACLQVGDQKLFNYIWKHPTYGALSGTDELLLRVSSPTDCVEVQEVTTDEIGAFVAHFEISQFQKRMTVSGKIMFEFLARGRLWCMKFYAMPDKKTKALGPWAVSLSIVWPSPPTWLDSRVVITEPRRTSSALPWPLPKDSAVASRLPSPPPDPGREKPPIQFRLQTKTTQLESRTSQKLKKGRHELVARFAEKPASSGLQYPDSAYYSPDGTLHVTMEARLAKPVEDADCVIC